MRNRGSLYAGLLVILLGIIMFLAQATRGGALFGMRLGWRAAWPFFILWAGAAFLLPLVVWWERRASLAGLVIPGTIITANGLVLLFQNVTGLWGTWAFLWTVEPMAVGLGLFLFYLIAERRSGVLLAASIVGGVGLLMFLIFSGVFTFLGPLLLIVVGVVLAAAGLGRGGRRASPPL
ncbi:MAG: hypothetical protein GX657_17260 [Chloroflexi bacterium]|jgi:hypothetical protein|nr:hypothetical protein [Chloroflexota bacterium]